MVSSTLIVPITIMVSSTLIVPIAPRGHAARDALRHKWHILRTQ